MFPSWKFHGATELSPLRRRGGSESQRAQSANAEEAGDLGELPAGGGRGPRAGGAGGPLAGGTDRNRAHPAAPEPPAALCQPVGSGEGAGLPVPGTRWVWMTHATRTYRWHQTSRSEIKDAQMCEATKTLQDIWLEFFGRFRITLILFCKSDGDKCLIQQYLPKSTGELLVYFESHCSSWFYLEGRINC